MTLHEIWEKAKTHLLTQKQQSEEPIKEDDPIGRKPFCLYRGPNGLKCAAGIFIDDKHYSRSLENLAVYVPAVKKALADSGFPVEDEKSLILLRRLQEIHDNSDPMDWEEMLNLLEPKD